MDRSTLIDVAEYLITAYRNVLNIDPYFRIKVEIAEAAKTSECVEDTVPAAWVVRLDPEKHSDVIDIQLSIIDAMMKVLFRGIVDSKDKEELVSRLTNSFSQLLPTMDEESSDQEDWVAED